MTLRDHLRALTIYSLAWAAFWLGGLPDYYQQYSAGFMAGFDLAATAPIAVVFAILLRRTPRAARLARSLWMAFYFSVLPAVYDWLYCGVYLGHGLAFLWRYWYLSVYYVVPWLLLPAIAAGLNRRDAAAS